MIRSIMLWLLLINSSSLFAQDTLAQARNFQQDATTLRPSQVLVVMVSQHGCSYCTLIREEFLLPMQRRQDAPNTVMIRELKIDQTQPVTDFDGVPRTAKTLAARYSANLTPTVLILDEKGTLLVPKLVGISTPDFYGYYLDTAIENARAIRLAKSK